ncbi:MAG: hypothetical protein ACYSYV_05505 [Planctomycetota bacterium]|jgi:hypothetical protein
MVDDSEIVVPFGAKDDVFGVHMIRLLINPLGFIEAVRKRRAAESK